VQHEVGAVERERLGVVRPRLLLEARVRLEERREAAELHPAQQQLLRAAVDQALAEVAADIVDQFENPDAAADSVAATSERSDQKSDAWSPPHVIPIP